MAEQLIPIIPPIDRDILKSELTTDRLARITRKGNNEIYIVNYHNAPHVLKEIGRLRELTFRTAGGGTGNELDLDEFDTCHLCYDQLIVWSPEDQEIVGGYRFIDCGKVYQLPQPLPLSTCHYFNLSSEFISDYLPYTIELGRSWVQPMFQPSVNPRKGLFALDNIWDGLGVLTVIYPELKYFFGKVTMYPEYNRECRDFLLYFMNHYFPDNDNLVRPISPIPTNISNNYSKLIENLNFNDGFKILNQFVRSKGENIPPLMNIYMHLSPTMKTFGTAMNHEFGGVEETGIMVTISDIFEEKKERHIKPLVNN